MVTPAYYQEHLRAFFAGRRVIAGVGPLAAATPYVTTLRDLGVEDFFVLADGRGAGSIPEPPVRWVDVSAPSHDLNASVRNYEARLSAPDDSWLPQVEAFDPEGDALAMVVFHAHLNNIAGRQAFGPRPASWTRYEDKLLIEAFWDRAGVARAPSAIADLHAANLKDVCETVDAGAGTVWAADNKLGWYGGAENLQWLPSSHAIQDAVSFFSERADQVRIMPFLDGLPCSIHGMVFEDHELAFRPVEMVVLRRPNNMGFKYAGAATYWDPAPADREMMRDVARRVGRQLRKEVDYRGVFTVDGVMTADGFRPTELNPRWGAGMNILTRSLPDLPLLLIDHALRHGLAFDYRPLELERLVLDSADAHRGGGAWCVIDHRPDSDVTHTLEHVGSEFSLAQGPAGKAGTLLLGQFWNGGFIRFVPDPSTMVVGSPVAPVVKQVFELADRALGTTLGTLSPAPLRR